MVDPKEDALTGSLWPPLGGFRILSRVVNERGAPLQERCRALKTETETTLCAGLTEL